MVHPIADHHWMAASLHFAPENPEDGECTFWYQLTRVVPDKVQRAVKWLCMCGSSKCKQQSYGWNFRKKTFQSWLKHLNQMGFGSTMKYSTEVWCAYSVCALCAKHRKRLCCFCNFSNAFINGITGGSGLNVLNASGGLQLMPIPDVALNTQLVVLIN